MFYVMFFELRRKFTCFFFCVIVQRKKSRFYLTTQTFQKSYQQKDKQPRGVEIGTWISFDKG